MFLKKFAFVGALGAALISTSATAQAETLRVAAESSYAPFIFVDSKTGDHVGFEVDLLKVLAKKIGAKLDITNMGFDAVIPSVMTGTANIGGSAITITKERATKVNFTTPYYDSGVSILINKADENTIKSSADLKNKTLCVQIGTSGAMLAKEIEGAQLRSFNAISDAYMELRNKGCQAVITDKPVTSYFMASRPRNQQLFKHLDEVLESEQFGFAVTKENTALLDKLNKALADVKQSGEFDQIYRKWFGAK
ncbi:MAG: basic amino acid ABC transporter substrate-binding protein [Duodenibacillus sp.]|nr:basic amino acid ABC transporter substrate-binding protein [Duodenibacillus sp.]